MIGVAGLPKDYTVGAEALIGSRLEEEQRQVLRREALEEGMGRDGCIKFPIQPRRQPLRSRGASSCNLRCTKIFVL